MTRLLSLAVREEVGTVLDPIEAASDVAATATRTLAARPASLDGQTLAVIDNRTNPRLRDGLVERLVARFKLADVIMVVKDTVNVPPRPEDWAEVTNRATVGLALFGA